MDVRKLVVEWVQRDGERAVESLMLDKGIGSTTRFKLLRGQYVSEPRGLLRATLSDLLRAAKMLQDEAS